MNYFFLDQNFLSLHETVLLTKSRIVDTASEGSAVPPREGGVPPPLGKAMDAGASEFIFKIICEEESSSS